MEPEAGRTFLLGLYNFGHEVRRLDRSLEQTNHARLKNIMDAGALLPSWSDCQPAETGQALASADIAPDLAADETQPKDIQAAVDASEDMQLAVQDFELTRDLYMVIGVCYISPSR